jgi:hypothetical protein
MSSKQKEAPGPEEPRELYSARLTPRAKNRLLALSRVKDKAAYDVLEEGFWLLWKALPEAERETAETIASALEKLKRSK